MPHDSTEYPSRDPELEKIKELKPEYNKYHTTASDRIGGPLKGSDDWVGQGIDA